MRKGQTNLAIPTGTPKWIHPPPPHLTIYHLLRFFWIWSFGLFLGMWCSGVMGGWGGVLGGMGDFDFVPLTLCALSPPNKFVSHLVPSLFYSFDDLILKKGGSPPPLYLAFCFCFCLCPYPCI